MDRTETAALLARLDAVRGLSGREEAVGEAIGKEMEGLFDEAGHDRLGNRLFTRRGRRGGPTVLLAAHMDEIGFLVSGIDEGGFVHFVPVGFHDERLLQNQMLRIDTASGAVYGVTGAGDPPYEHKGEHPETPRMGEIVLDIGARSREEAEAMGVCPGDPVLNAREGRLLGKRVFTGRAVDNRAGCAAMIGAMRLLAEAQLPATVVACASVQEDLGAKGIGAVGARVKPDIALALDVCPAVTDGRIPGGSIPHTRARIVQGGGPAVQIYDWSPGSLLGHAVSPRLYGRLLNTARRRRIPHQAEVTLDCGTDAAVLAPAGVLAGGISIPCRYLHSAAGTVDIGDVYYAAVLTAEFIKSLSDPL